MQLSERDLLSILEGMRATRALQEKCAAAGDWGGALCLCSSEERLPFVAAVWRRIPSERRPSVFADAYGSGDNPAAARRFVLRALREFSKLGVCAFDAEDGPAELARLPSTVTVWRGTVLAEPRSRRIGTSWTLVEERARWFATEHGRFRNCMSEPCLLMAHVKRESIGALLLDREEREVVVHPRFLQALRWQRLASSRPAVEFLSPSF